MSSSKGNGKRETMEQMEKEMAKKAMLTDPEHARLLMISSSHSVISTTTDRKQGVPIPNKFPNQDQIKEPGAENTKEKSVQEIYKKDNSLHANTSAEDKGKEVLESSATEIPVEKPISKGKETLEPDAGEIQTEDPISKGKETLEPDAGEIPIEEPISKGKETLEPDAGKIPIEEPISKGKETLEHDAGEIPIEEPISKGKETLEPDAGEIPIEEPISKGKETLEPDAGEIPIEEPISKGKETLEPDAGEIPVEKPIFKGKKSLEPDAGEILIQEPISKGEETLENALVKEPLSEENDSTNPAGKNNIPSWQNSKEIFSLPQVSLFAISSSKSSAKLIEFNSLRIVEVPGRIPEDATKDSFNQFSNPPAFIQVGVWIYPLIPYNSPIYRSEEGHYIFPDLKADKAGASNGLVLPANTYQSEIEAFEGILKSFAAIEEFTFAPPMMFGNTSKLIDQAKRDEEVPINISKDKTNVNSTFSRSKDKVSIKRSASRTKQEAKKQDVFNCNGAMTMGIGGLGFGGNKKDQPPKTNHTAQFLSTKIADGIVAGAEVISRGITYSANKTSEILDQGSGLLKSYKEGPPTNPREIHKGLHKGVKVAKTYTGKFVELSGYVVDELGNATVALAAFLSPYLHQTTTTLVTKVTGSNPEDSNYIVDNFLEVTSGTFQGMQMVYSGLYDASKILAKSITNNTVQVITHYYGSKAGEIIDDACETVGNIALGGAHTQSLNPKSVMKRALKETGTVLITKENNNA